MQTRRNAKYFHVEVKGVKKVFRYAQQHDSPRFAPLRVKGKCFAGWLQRNIYYNFFRPCNIRNSTFTTYFHYNWQHPVNQQFTNTIAKHGK